MTELATAYVSIVGDASGIPKEIKSAFGQAEREAGPAGKSMGGRMSSALGTALKAGAASVAAAGVATIGTAMVKGFQRLDAIDQARAKLTGLGNDGAEVQQIMDNALASVRGTAFGMGDAASLAGVMVAAGIEPGRELEDTLKRVADSAAIAGTDLNDMGQIWGKAAAKGKIDGEIINQMLERQIPIYDILGDKMGKTSEEIAKMVSEGKISFEDFSDAMENRVGGAALEMGNTVSGAFANMNAALGRLGATALEPFFERLPAGMGSVTEALDAMEPKVRAIADALSHQIFDEWGPKIRSAFEEFRDSGRLDSVVGTFRGLGDALADAAPHLGRLASGLAEASAALGVSGWELFLTALEAGTGLLQILNPLLSTTADLVSNNTGLVTALMGAWLAFKTVPSLVTGVTTVLTPMATGIRTAATNLSGFGGAWSQSLTYMRQANPQLSTAGAHLAVLRTNAGQAGSALSGGLRSGLSGIVGALGGPVGIGITATLGAGMWALSEYAGRQQEAAQRAREHDEAVRALSESVNHVTGELDAAGKQRVFDDLNEMGVWELLEANDQLGISLRQFQQAAEGSAPAIEQVNEALDRQVQASIEAGDAWRRNAEDAREAGITMDMVVAAQRGNVEAQREIGELAMAAGWDDVWNAWKRLGSITDDAGRAAIELGHALGTVTDRHGDAVEAARRHAEAAGQAAQNLIGIADQFKGADLDFKLEVETTAIAGAQEELEALDFTVRSLANGKVEISADNEEALVKLELVRSGILTLDQIKANPDVDLNTMMFEAKDDETRQRLRELHNSTADPQVGAIIDGLLQGHSVSLQKLTELDQTSAHPLVELLIEQLLQNAASANQALDETARARTATITVRTVQQYDTTDSYGNSVGNTYSLPRNADGSVRRRAHGGIDGLTEPTFKAGSGAGDFTWTPYGPVQWAEGETEGESFIPWARSKRERATGLLAVTADAFGFQLLPKDALPASISGRLGAITGHITSALVQSTGIDGFRKYADGGFLRDLAQGGHGASRPLTGAPYDWGGVNWGDCSGAMSAFARAAAGLPIFGGRFSTGTMASDIPAMGGQLGRGGPGDLRFGWYNGGPGGGHTAGTLPDGTNIEMGGGYGGGMLGGSVGADDPQFTHHAFFPIRPEILEWYAYGPDQGGYVTRPDGTVVPYGGPGTFGGTGGGSGATGGGAGGSSISGRFGAAAGAFVEGHLADIFQTLSINDTPGVLGAIAEYENTQRDPNVAGVDETKLQEDFERARLDQRQQFENEELQRRQEHEAELAELERRRESKELSEEEYDRLAAELKAEFDRTELEKKQEFERAELDAERLLESERSTDQDRPSVPPLPPGVTDPGMHAPGEGEDIGPGADSAGSVLDPHPIKNAVMQALQPRGWHTGDHWAATEWIKDKESGPDWDNVDATNGQYFGLFQLGDEAWRAAGLEKSTDGQAQGESYGHYVDARYEDPVQAKQAWEHQGWYDVGGRLREGTTLVHNGLGHEETVLPFRPEDLKDSLDGGGELGAKLDQLIGLLMARPQEVHHNTFRDERAYHDAVKRRSRSRMAAAGGGRL